MSHRTNRLAIAVLGGLLALLPACMGPRGTAQNTYVAEREGDDVEELLGDPGLARELALESVRTERRDGRLFVQFDLRNLRSSNLPIEWNIAWIDRNGFFLDTPQNWTSANLGGKGFETISRTAPTPEASGFRLGVRRPNTVR